jgi:hypothetical protein
MQTISLIMGIMAILGMLVGFFPCLGSLNWLVIPFAAIGIIISGIALGTASPHESKTGSISGLVMSVVALIFGLFRLILGGGVL